MSIPMKEVYEFLKKCNTYYLATVEADGQPRVRPFGTIDLFEDKLYIQPIPKQKSVLSTARHGCVLPALWSEMNASKQKPTCWITTPC